MARVPGLLPQTPWEDGSPRLPKACGDERSAGPTGAAATAPLCRRGKPPSFNPGELQQTQSMPAVTRTRLIPPPFRALPQLSDVWQAGRRLRPVRVAAAPAWRVREGCAQAKVDDMLLKVRDLLTNTLCEIDGRDGL